MIRLLWASLTLVYQDVIDAFQHTHGWTSKRGMQKVNEQLFKGLPEGPEEVGRLGRTLWPGRAQVPAFYKRGGASNGPVEAINGRHEHLRGIAPGFGHFTRYVTRSLLEAPGGNATTLWDSRHALFCGRRDQEIQVNPDSGLWHAMEV